MICAQKKALSEAHEARRKAAREARLGKVTPTSASRPPEPAGNLVCWWCVHGLAQLPCIHVPTDYDDRRDLFTVRGNFCSWPCAKAWAQDNGGARAGEIQTIMALMRRRIFGHYVPLWPAPKRESLQIFGGSLTIEEFRKYGGKVEPPPIHWPDERITLPVSDRGGPEVHTTQSASADRQKDRGKLKAIGESTSSGDSLKLRRTKPLQRAESKLENVLGITRKSKD